jgi:hypothetical protein
MLLCYKCRSTVTEIIIVHRVTSIFRRILFSIHYIEIIVITFLELMKCVGVRGSVVG